MTLTDVRIVLTSLTWRAPAEGREREIMHGRKMDEGKGGGEKGEGGGEMKGGEGGVRGGGRRGVEKEEW